LEQLQFQRLDDVVIETGFDGETLVLVSSISQAADDILRRFETDIPTALRKLC
jgi:hypothetical protein